MKYKVRFYQDNLYEVIKHTEEGVDFIAFNKESADNVATEISIFKGTLPECDAFVNLKEKGYI